ncbi:MAG TPA: isoprenylcysteine carboxylmethyltransferase family protein [Coleofasciculaceae cyanobacterium]
MNDSTSASTPFWKGTKGEYWVLAQLLLLVGFVWVPVYPKLPPIVFPWQYGIWFLSGLLAGLAALLLGRGVIDLGRNLTPLPYPKETGSLVQKGIYELVRHPLYSGLILGALGWAIFHISLSHLLGVLVLLLFFNAKADREEIWLSQKYPEYGEYQSHVKKLLPWLY